MALILRKGYEAITVQDLIDEADVSRSTFYAHYTGKEDLLRRGFEMLRDELAAARRAGLAQSDLSPDEPLRFSRAMFEHAARYTEIYRAMVGGRGGTVALAEIRQVLVDLVGKEPFARDDGAPRELVVQLVVASFLTVLTWWLERRPKLPASQVDAMFRRLVLAGIARAPTLARITPPSA